MPEKVILTKDELTGKDKINVSELEYNIAAIDFGGYVRHITIIKQYVSYNDSDVKIYGYDGYNKKYIDIKVDKSRVIFYKEYAKGKEE